MISKKRGKGGKGWELYNSIDGKYTDVGYPEIEVDGKKVKVKTEEQLRDIWVKQNYGVNNFDDLLKEGMNLSDLVEVNKEFMSQYDFNKMLDEGIAAANERLKAGEFLPVSQTKKEKEAQEKSLIDTSDNWIFPEEIQNAMRALEEGMTSQKKREIIQELLETKKFSEWPDQYKRMWIDGIFNVPLFEKSIVPYMKEHFKNDLKINEFFNERKFMRNEDERLDVFGVDYCFMSFVPDENGTIEKNINGTIIKGSMKPNKKFMDLKTLSKNANFKLGFEKVLGFLGKTKFTDNNGKEVTLRPQLTSIFLLNQINDNSVDLTDIERGEEEVDFSTPNGRDDFMDLCLKTSQTPNSMASRIKSSSVYGIHFSSLYKNAIANNMSEDEILETYQKFISGNAFLEFSNDPDYKDMGDGKFRRYFKNGMWIEVDIDKEKIEFRFNPRNFFTKGKNGCLFRADDLDLQKK